jgi:hypothetical protein
MKSTSEKIIENIIGFEDWCEKNKRSFIKKNNPELYKKIYNSKNNDENRCKYGEVFR